MEISRKLEILVATSERYVVRESSRKKIACPKCGEPMLTAEQAAAILGVMQRRIFQIIEANAVHFTEAEAGAVMICITSMGEFLSCEMRLAAELKCEEINES